jgi:branched-chain amino acid transport system ATP-binding protein
MLRVDNLDVAYDHYQVLWNVSIVVNEGEIVCILGPNGAGKSTLMNSISGLVPTLAGTVEFLGVRINDMPCHKIVPLGLSHVLERRRLFPYLSVRQNLMLGAYNPKAKKNREVTLEEVFSLFPILRKRAEQLAHTLSGGEQQMVALGRGLMSQPKLLMCDEPFLGFAPSIMLEIIDAFLRIREEGVTILFIEQNVEQALDLSDRGYILESGRVSLEGEAQSLTQNRKVKEVYLGS